MRKLLTTAGLLLLVLTSISSDVRDDTETFTFGAVGLQQEPDLYAGQNYSKKFHPQLYYIKFTVQAPDLSRTLDSLEIELNEEILEYAGLMNMTSVSGGIRFTDIYEGTLIQLLDLSGDRLDSRGFTLPDCVVLVGPYGKNFNIRASFTRSLSVLLMDQLDLNTIALNSEDGELEIAVTGRSLCQSVSNLSAYFYKIFWVSNLRGSITYTYR